MPNPTTGDLRVDQVLTNISIAYIQRADDFVADKVFPVVPSEVQSDRYAVYARDDFFRNEMRKRGPGTPSAGAGYRIDNTPSFFADVWALHKDVDDQTRRNQRQPVDLDRDTAIFLTQQALIRRDKEFVSQYFTTSKWTGASGGTDLTGVSGAPGANQVKQWDQASSTPIKDIRTQRVAVKKKTGFYPNTLVLGAEVWAILQDHSDFLDRIKYTQRGMITPDLLAAVLELDKVVIGAGIEVTTPEEASTDTYAFLEGKHALLVYANPTPSLMQPSGGYTFSWTGLVGAGPQGNRVKSFRMEENEADRIEIEMAFAMKLVAADLGAFFTTVVG
jgi:hypothetical protein